MDADPFDRVVLNALAFSTLLSSQETDAHHPSRDIGYTLAARSCEGADCVGYAPSRPLMRSLLSQFQTPTTPRRAVGFFGSGRSPGRPSELITQLTLDWPPFIVRSRSLTPRRHATAQSFATRIAGRLPFGSPPPSFESVGSMPPGSPDSVSWLEPASRSGLSLSRNDCPSPGHHSEVKAPDLLLRHPTAHSSGPFGLRFPCALRFAPACAGSLP